jgi:hypothetical protein
MPKEPGFYFYTGDWLKDPGLKICSKSAKGCWIDMLALLSECPFRGVFVTGDGVPWTDQQIAGAIGGDAAENVKAITELLRLGVASRNQKGAIYSRRMVRDQQIKEQAAARKRKERSGISKCHTDVTANVTPLSEEEGERETGSPGDFRFYRPATLPLASELLRKLNLAGSPLLQQTVARAIELKMLAVNQVESTAPEVTLPEVADWMEKQAQDFIRHNAGTKSKSLMTFFSEGLYDDAAVLGGLSVDDVRLKREAAVGKA